MNLWLGVISIFAVHNGALIEFSYAVPPIVYSAKKCIEVTEPEAQLISDALFLSGFEMLPYEYIGPLTEGQVVVSAQCIVQEDTTQL